jgi:excisionase family DNA binding protein
MPPATSASGRTFMFRLLATGAIESFKIGSRRKITRDALDAYLNRLQSELAARPKARGWR